MTHMASRAPRAVAIALLCALATGCSEGATDDGRTQISATTTQVADLVRQVAGDRARVNGILPPGADPHEYEPRPSDVANAAAADVVFKSGGEVDRWADQLLESAGGTAPVVELIGSAKRRGVDPHWWQDPRNAIRAVETIRDRLAAADPGGREGYRSNAARYVAALKRVDRTIAGCIDRLEPDRRTLVTEHDALGYYADRYGLRLIGTVIPALTTHAQPSAGETAALVRRVRAERVLAIFPEHGINPDLAAAIAEEAGARVGGPLYSDSLGPAGSAGATYVDALLANTDTIVGGLSGGEVRCSGPG